MPEQSIYDYINEQRQNGFSDGKIADALSQSGWDSATVKQLLGQPVQGSVPQFLEGKKAIWKRSWFISATSALGALIIIAAAGGYYFYNSPKAVAARMYASLQKVQSFSYDGNIDLSNASDATQSFKLAFNGQADLSKQPNSNSVNATINYNATGMQISAGLNLIAADNKMYLQLEKLPALIPQQISSQLEGKWVEFDLQTLAGAAAAAQIKSQQQIANGNFNLSQSQKLQVAQDLFKHQFLSLKPATGSGNDIINQQPTYHYSYIFDKQQFQQFLVQAASVTNQKLNQTDLDQLQKSLQNMQNLTGEIWIYKQNEFPARITMNLKLQDSAPNRAATQISADLNFSNYNQAINISAPSQSEPLTQFLQQFSNGASMPLDLGSQSSALK